MIFKHPLFNYSFGHAYVWDSIKVLVTYESDWKKAYQILSDMLEARTRQDFEKANREIQRWADQYLMKFHHVRPRIVIKIEDSGVLFSFRYLCETSTLLDTRQEISRAILEAFEADESIQFAYPTQRIVPTARPEEFSIQCVRST